MKYEGLKEYAKEHTIKECAKKYKCCYKCMNSYLYKHNIDYKRDYSKPKGKLSLVYKHGEINTRLYQIWLAMRHRCNDKNNKHYGAKGITVCAEWNDFLCFKEWAIKNGYNDKLSIDRIDNSRSYNPDNCRWVDTIAQHNNMSSNRLITYRGETKTVSQWAKEYNIVPQTLYSRLNRGWSISRAIGAEYAD